MQIDFYFDPLCPWCWITSRWITEVSEHRDLKLTWRPFSLAIKNDPEDSKDYNPVREWGLRGLRIIEAVRREVGEAAVARVYAEMGARKHNDGVAFPDHADVLATLGLDSTLAAAADDESWDSVIRESMEAALELAGDDVGVPTIVYEGRTAFFGPVISPAPTGDAAVRLWDSLATLATTTDGFFELKRTREVGPIFGERPQP
jgi:predicted DsbA family dithiol-disulfide isomerase